MLRMLAPMFATVLCATVSSAQPQPPKFERVGDKMHLIRKNVRYKSKDGPLARALETTYTDSVLIALPIKSIHPIRQSVLIDFNQIFFTNFADLPFGFLDNDRTTWNKLK